MSGAAYRRWVKKMKPPRQERVCKKTKKKKKIKFTCNLAATVDTMMEARRVRLARREKVPKAVEGGMVCLCLR